MERVVDHKEIFKAIRDNIKYEQMLIDRKLVPNSIKLSQHGKFLRTSK